MPSAASRSSSCSAALRLKASMRMPEGSQPRSTSSTTRLISVLVLPEPAGASTRAGPRAWRTAARCASSKRAASGPEAGDRTGRGEEPAGSGPSARPGGGGAASAGDTPSSRPTSSRSSAAAPPAPRRRRAKKSRTEREAEAVRELTGEQRVHEPQEDGGGLCLELLHRPLPVPHADGRVSAEQAAPRLAGILRPVAPGSEADAGGGRRRSLREVAAARHAEEDETRGGGGACAAARPGGSLDVLAGRHDGPAGR